MGRSHETSGSLTALKALALLSPTWYTEVKTGFLSPNKKAAWLAKQLHAESRIGHTVRKFYFSDWYIEKHMTPTQAAAVELPCFTSEGHDHLPKQMLHCCMVNWIPPVYAMRMMMVQFNWLG